MSPTYLWDLVDDLKITRLCISPTILDKMEDENYTPGNVFLYAFACVKDKNCSLKIHIHKHKHILVLMIFVKLFYLKCNKFWRISSLIRYTGILTFHFKKIYIDWSVWNIYSKILKTLSFIYIYIYIWYLCTKNEVSQIVIFKCCYSLHT